MVDSGDTATELTATQYVILAENQRKKKALADSKRQFSAVADENRLLLRQLEDTQRENYEVTEHLRRELLAKTERVASLEAELQTLTTDKAEEAAKAAAIAAAETTRKLGEAAMRQQELQDQVDTLTADLAKILDFKDRQAEVEDGLVRLKEENAQLRERLEQQRTELERYYMELNTKMRKEYEQRLEELTKSAEEEIDERLDASVKRILTQNRRMADELKIHVQETEVLQKEVGILEAERGRLCRELQLKVELEKGYATRGAKQSVALKDANGKIMSLEASLQQVLAGFERERAALCKGSAAAVSDASTEADALRRLVKLKTRELKNIRRLAHEVLLQRSDVETFLLSSLHQVRREVERESIAVPTTSGARTLTSAATSAAVATTTAGVPSDAFGGGNTGILGQPLTGQAGRIDLKDLPWEDRERVLRLLFSKINNQAQHAYFSNLPVHGLDMHVAGDFIEGGFAG